MVGNTTIISVLTIFSFLLGCAGTEDRVWQSDFRFGLSTESYVRHQLIPQYFDSIHERGENFYLYYFTKGPMRQQDPRKSIKTILFCAGGPGEVFWPKVDQTWLKEFEEDYRVVYFHLRGAGFSQFPESNAYDSYLRTKYAVEDIEKIFNYLKKDDPSFEKWDAVVGFSYGTVLAQQYTAKNPALVKSLVLASPISRHPFKRGVEDPQRSKFVKDIATAYGVLLENIFETNTIVDDSVPTNTFKKQFPKFFSLIERPDYDKKQIIRDITTEMMEIIDIQDRALLSANPLIDFYDELKKLEPQGTTVKEEQLTALQRLARFDRQFFIDLKELRNEGWGETVHQSINDIGIAGRALRIAAEVLRWGKNRIDIKERFKEIFHIQATDLCGLLSDQEWRRQNQQIESEAEMYGIWCDKVCICSENAITADVRFVGSRRVFYNMAIYDGLDAGFLEIWPRTSAVKIIELLKRKDWWYFDPFLRTVGFVTNELPEAWDPGEPRYQHSVPTLILRGRADPTTGGGQANYIFENALRGPRYMVEFDGIGHELKLGLLQVLPRLPRGAKTRLCGFEKDSTSQTATVDTKACIIESFMNNEWGTLEDVLVLYSDKFSPSLDQPGRSWISDRPVTCNFARTPIRMLTNHQQKEQIVTDSVCETIHNTKYEGRR